MFIGKQKQKVQTNILSIIYVHNNLNLTVENLKQEKFNNTQVPINLFYLILKQKIDITNSFQTDLSRKFTLNC